LDIQEDQVAVQLAERLQVQEYQGKGIPVVAKIHMPVVVVGLVERVHLPVQLRQVDLD